MGSVHGVSTGFVPPPYPYDRLGPLKEVADAHDGGAVDVSVGTPCDPPPPFVSAALASSGSERGYPPSIGTPRFREAAAGWMARRLDVEIDPDHLAACVGTKELVGTLPQYLKLRSPERDTVLYPAVSYPTYAMGATLAGLRAVPVPVDERWSPDLSVISDEDARRALVLWVNSPGNPAGQVDDLGAAAEWGRAHGVPVFSDECYVEFSWAGPPRTILTSGTAGVVAVHSLSKRSNFAGGRAGFYAGDPELVEFLREVRKHAGFLVPGPVQAAAAAAWDDDDHVDAQRERYRERLERLRGIVAKTGSFAPLPAGAFYLWAAAPDGDAWHYATVLAEEAGLLVTPGDTFGEQGRDHVRLAAVQPLERLDLVARRLGL